MLFKQYFVKQLVFSVFYRTVWQTARYEEAIKTCPPLCPREIWNRQRLLTPCWHRDK